MTTTDRIDGLASGLAIKTPVRVATTTNITLSGLQTIDGVTVAAGDRVLVKDQNTTTENGIYDAASTAWTRSKDFDGNRDATDGTLVAVRAGTANADKVYRLSATNPVVFGTSALTWTAVLTFTSLPLAVGSGGTGVTTINDLKTALGLGTAAYLPVGTSANNVVQLNGSAQLPAVDGSNLTNLTGANITGGVPYSPGALYGLTLSNAAEADHDITIAAGKCRNEADTANATLAAALTKQADVTWAEGTNQGGAFPTTSLPTSGTYHVILISKDADGTIDAGFDTDPDGANCPSGWSVVRRLGSLVTDSSANFRPFYQNLDHFLLKAPPLDYSSALSTSAASLTLSVPSGIRVEATLSISSGTGAIAISFYSPDQTDQTPSLTVAPLNQLYPSNGRSKQIRIWTNASSQIRAVAASGTPTVYVSTNGWVDYRGRLG